MEQESLCSLMVQLNPLSSYSLVVFKEIQQPVQSALRSNSDLR